MARRRLVLEGPAAAAVERLAEGAEVSPAELIRRALRREDEAQRQEGGPAGAEATVQGEGTPAYQADLEARITEAARHNAEPEGPQRRGRFEGRQVRDVDVRLSKIDAGAPIIFAARAPRERIVDVARASERQADAEAPAEAGEEDLSRSTWTIVGRSFHGGSGPGDPGDDVAGEGSAGERAIPGRFDFGALAEVVSPGGGRDFILRSMTQDGDLLIVTGDVEGESVRVEFPIHSSYITLQSDPGMAAKVSRERDRD